MPAYLIVYYNVTNSEQFKKYLEVCRTFNA